MSHSRTDQIAAIGTAAEAAANTAKRALDRCGPLYDAHHGLGLLREEIRELEDEIFKQQTAREPVMLRKEALDVAAVALRIASQCDAEWVKR